MPDSRELRFAYEKAWKKAQKAEQEGVTGYALTRLVKKAKQARQAWLKAKNG